MENRVSKSPSLNKEPHSANYTKQWSKLRSVNDTRRGQGTEEDISNRLQADRATSSEERQLKHYFYVPDQNGTAYLKEKILCIVCITTYYAFTKYNISIICVL